MDMDLELNVEETFTSLIALNQERKKLLLTGNENPARLMAIDKQLNALNASVADLPMAELEGHVARHEADQSCHAPSTQDSRKEDQAKSAQGNDLLANGRDDPERGIENLDLQNLLALQASINAQIEKILKAERAATDLTQASTSNPDSFVTPSLKRKKKSAPSTQSKAFIIETNNRFGVLETEPMETPVTEDASQSGPMTVEFAQKPRRVPPLIITQQVDWKTLSTSLKSMTTDDFSGKLNSDTLKIQPKNPTDYRTISHFLTEQKFNFHTYKLNEEKTLKVVIRGIPSNTPTSEIEEELKNLNFPVVSVNQLKGAKTRKPLPLFLIDLTKSQEGKDIFNLKTLAYLKITVESYRRRKGPTQCHACQRFGHVQSSCHTPHRCVKCAGSHHTRECTKNIETPPTCINCSGSHTANYRLCPAYQKLVQSNTPSLGKDFRVKPGITFSDALKGPRPINTEPQAKHTNDPKTSQHSIPSENHSKNKSVLNDLLGLIPLIREIGYENVRELISLLNVNPGGFGSLTGSSGMGPLALSATSGLSRV